MRDQQIIVLAVILGTLLARPARNEVKAGFWRDPELKLWQKLFLTLMCKSFVRLAVLLCLLFLMLT